MILPLVAFLLAQSVGAVPQAPALMHPQPAVVWFEKAPFVSKEGRFSIMLPPEYPRPKLEVTTIKSDDGPIKLRMYSSMNSEQGLCLIGYCDFNGASIDDELRAKILDGAKEGALENMQATLESDSAITVDGRPGRSIRFSAQKNSETMYGRFDYFLVGIRLYQIGFLSLTRDVQFSASIGEFFDSFKVSAAPQKGAPRKGTRKGKRR